ncbi:MAG: sigma 54-interacting transcriptional regulator, partial [Deltaproteobacteria bacterium]|nr:sigma 54-interacting transcriptional regulator [Deltaproteobacteria bacterium]
AGLSAGCYGQMNGYKTRIFELHDKPGGLCTSWKRKGYTFDGCIEWTIGSKAGTPVNRIFAELPAQLVARALRVAADRERHGVQRAILRVRAWQRDGQLLPAADEIAVAVESLQQRGASQAVAALAAAWLPNWREQSDPQLPRIAAAWLRAVADGGNLADAADLTHHWPAAWSAEANLALARAELAFRAGDYPGCRSLAEAILQRDPQQAEAWLWLAFAATWQGDRQAAQPAMVRAAALAAPGSDTADLLDYLQGLHEYYAGQLDPAEHRLRALLRRTRPGLWPAIQGALGLVAHRRGDLAAAREHYGMAASLAQAQGDRSRALNMAMNLAVIDHESGELGAALAGYRRVIDLAEHNGNPGAAARAKTNRGNLLASLGLLDAALGDLTAAVPFWQEVGNHHLLGNALCVLGEIARRQGRAGDAAELLARADRALEQAGAVTERLEIQIELGQIELAAAHVDQARQRGLEVRQAAASAGHSEWHGRALTLLAQCELDAEPWLAVPRDRMAALDDDLRLALDLLPASKALHRNQACALRARLLLQRGQIDDARQLAQQQVGVLQRVAATLRGAERAAFERDPADAAARTLLQALAQLPEVPHGGSARPGLVPTLLAVNRRLGEQRDIPQILETLMDSAILLTGAERGFLVLDEGDPGTSVEVRATQLKVAVARNLDRENLKKPQHKLSHTVAEEVFLTGESVLSLDAQVDTRFADQASVHGGALRSILCVALRSQTGSLGVVYVDNRFASGAFTDEHATVLSALADQAAIAIHTARLLQAQRDTAEALRKSRAEVEDLNAQLRSQLAEVEHELDDVRADLQAQRLAIAHRSDYSQIKGESPQLLQVFSLMDRVRDHDFPLLLVGESGTGKELVARAIHFTGRRKRGPFVAINCGALPANLLESELFGHARGSFTGAVAERRGLFEAAHTGTLLLDEVGEMPLEMQVKLLRVLQTSEFNRVGESTLRRVDVRVIAATHRDLAAMVRAGTFREDLLYRLKVVELRIPPLRERPGDIAVLAEHFLRENRAAGIGKVESIGKAALQRLLQFSWPGNVRQLEMVLKSACLFADSPVLERSDIDSLLQRERGGAVASARGEPEAWWSVASLDVIEARVVAARLAAMGGNKRKAAESLGIDRGTLYKKLQQAQGEA